MITLLLVFTLLYACLKLCMFVFRVMWEVMKFVIGLSLLPLILIGLVLACVFSLALPALVVIGIIALIASISKRSMGYEGGC